MHARSKNTKIFGKYSFFSFIFPNPSSHYPFISHVMPDKAVFVSAVLLCVQHYQGNPVYFYCFKSGTLWQRMNLHFHSDQRKKTNKWAGNMLMFHVNMKLFGILETTRFNDSESTLSFERQ